jgi:hypothetical protein
MFFCLSFCLFTVLANFYLDLKKLKINQANQQQTSGSLCDRFWKKASNSTSQLTISS